MDFKLTEQREILNDYNLSINCGTELTQVSGKFDPRPVYKKKYLSACFSSTCIKIGTKRKYFKGMAKPWTTEGCRPEALF